jgi:hypothetical protein
MDFTVRHDAEAHLVLATISGPLSLPDMEATVRAVIACPGADPTDHILTDHTGISAPITPPDLERFLAILEFHADGLRRRCWAIIAGTPASYGMMRMLSVGASRIQLDVRVFHDEAAARAWLADPTLDRE